MIRTLENYIAQKCICDCATGGWQQEKIPILTLKIISLIYIWITFDFTKLFGILFN